MIGTEDHGVASLLAFLEDANEDGAIPVWPALGYPGPVSASPAEPKRTPEFQASDGVRSGQ
jgi:hypothetical protein